MEVTFGNSSALSRAHYSLVQRVENAETSQAVNDIIVQEVNVIRNVLTRSTSSSVWLLPEPIIRRTHLHRSRCEQNV